MREINFAGQLICAPSNCRSTLFDELFLDFHSFDDMSVVQLEVILQLQGLQYGIVGVSIIFDPRTHLCEDHQV